MRILRRLGAVLNLAAAAREAESSFRKRGGGDAPGMPILLGLERCCERSTLCYAVLCSAVLCYAAPGMPSLPADSEGLSSTCSVVGVRERACVNQRQAAT